MTKTLSAYEEYIRSYKWALKRKEALAFHGRICSNCGATSDLQVHHLTYEHLFDEPMEDLQILCDSCHGKVHGYIISKPRPGRIKRTFRLSPDAVRTLEILSEKRGMSESEVLEAMVEAEWEKERKRVSIYEYLGIPDADLCS